MIDNEKILAGVEVLKEFKDKLKTLCDEYTQKVSEACPENISSGLWDERAQTVHSIYIMLSGEENGVTKDELISENFKYKHSSRTSDFYQKVIDGIDVTYAFKKEKQDEV